MPKQKKFGLGVDSVWNLRHNLYVDWIHWTCLFPNGRNKMRNDDDMMQAPFDIDPVKFEEIMAAFREMESKNPEDYDLGELPEIGDYEGCPMGFNQEDFI